MKHEPVITTIIIAIIVAAIMFMIVQSVKDASVEESDLEDMLFHIETETPQGETLSCVVFLGYSDAGGLDCDWDSTRETNNRE